MGIPIVDLRQDRRHYYLRLGYAPDFYRTLARFERAIGPHQRRYEPELGMWRVSKEVAPLLPHFFPNFEALAAGRVLPVRLLPGFIPYRGLARPAAYALVVLLALFAWRTDRITPVAEAARERVPTPLARLASNPRETTLASMLGLRGSNRPLVQIRRPGEAARDSEVLLRAQAVRDEQSPGAPLATPAETPEVVQASAEAGAPAAPAENAAAPEANPALVSFKVVGPQPGLPAACRAEGAPLGIVWLAAPMVMLHEGPDSGSRTVGAGARGAPVCIYKIEGEWQGGTMEHETHFVWMHQSFLSINPPEARR
jgi:hypothetical protein